MSIWTSGYVADIDYTYGYYPELNPLHCKLGLLNSGLKSPEFGTACELGFGQGLSTNIHAAGSRTEWWGTDFNPAQAGFAQELASAAQSGAQVFDDAFGDFCTRKDLPDFDFIGLHGIWSWISDENRKVIVDFVRRKLRVGGVLYVSYNTLPGWASFAPLRHLMTQHAEVMGSSGGGIVNKIDGALDFTQRLLDTNPSFKRANPHVEERLKKMLGQSRHYLAHEYFNKDWHPMHFATAANWLDPAKVDFACSAHYLDQFASVNLTKEQQNFLNEIQDPLFRQSVFDFMINQQFRRDYWVKGTRRLSPLEKSELLNEQRIILVTPRREVSLKVSGGQGEATMNESVYAPILDALSNHEVTTIGELTAKVQPLDEKLKPAAVVEAVLVLASGGNIMPAQEEEVIESAQTKTNRLNKCLIQKARSGGKIGHLASPVTGGGMGLTRFQQLFLGAKEQGANTPEQMAQSAWRYLERLGERIVKDGSPLETVSDNVTELSRQAEDFISTKLPIAQALRFTDQSAPENGL